MTASRTFLVAILWIALIMFFGLAVHLGWLGYKSTMGHHGINPWVAFPLSVLSAACAWCTAALIDCVEHV